MYIFEVVVPGTWIVHEDRDFAWEIQASFFTYFKTHFYDANLALNSFVIAQQNADLSLPTEEEWDKDRERRSQISRAIEKEAGGWISHDNYDSMLLETEMRFKREKWSTGNMPRSFRQRAPFIHAKSFLYALDGFDKFLKVLAYKTEKAPEALKGIHEQMGVAFPDLRGVRDTSQHLEDRARFLDRNGKPLKLTEGPLMLDCLSGSRYGSTMNDGHYGEVDVSPDSMLKLRDIFQAVLGAFEWRGSKQHLPLD